MLPSCSGLQSGAGWIGDTEFSKSTSVQERQQLTQALESPKCGDSFVSESRGGESLVC